MDTILETEKLSKRFGGFEAVRDLNLRVQKGSICAFLGQNGAGKTTTLRMLLGMMRPSRGAGHILGLRIDDEAESVRIRERVAFVAEDKRLYDYMTVRQILRFTKSFFPGWRTDRESDLLRRLDLPLGCKIRKLSKGMRTKLALLLAFARGSEFFILDEPKRTRYHERRGRCQSERQLFRWWFDSVEWDPLQSGRVAGPVLVRVAH
jgi:ABC-2 type transport system ATP-binding protein